MPSHIVSAIIILPSTINTLSSVATSPDEKEKGKKKNKKPNYAYSGTGDEVLTILAMA